ncbi:PREDICTED: uncharacterized protein LOC103343323 [Prunus mume]|uniref:Uncharacterized protein LOC103343323 n=1 Tax=Prunus mume TaxID=102107 RepID=A0ABM0PVM6_PRUMU|nr:PREDICTED: uncharacterized protein LOC103343323 [Prunus mume]XP_008245212.1 PREDICTED: uncharacterized protein LOC103343323 [Prunus mume]XP_008245213.1 PREDICTED: uncharacterized protein LOC103343323 [Prunus mume]
MAATVSLSFSLDPQHHHLFSNTTHFKPHQTPLPPFSPLTSTLFPKYPLAIFHKSHPSAFKSSSSPSHSSTTTTTTTASDTTATDTATTTSTTTTSSSFLEYPLRTGRFLSSEELEQLKLLENFRYYQELESGSMWVRVMRPEEMDITVGLLSESFAESMLLPSGYVSVLGYLVKQYLFERMELSPHTATLIGFYRRRKEEGEEQQEKNTEDEEEVDEVEFLAGTVEVCFDKKGANASPPTPTPPKNSPYISNMAVKKSLRRRGIGWHLLKASEELISQMSSSREAYLHCRMIDTAPFNMYKKAGYDIVKTDNILVMLLLQRRKHLMCKKLPVLTSFSESDTFCSEEELTS